jgi:hypothetical protein
MISKDASRKAANTAEDASRLANQTQWDMYKQSRADQMPWLAAGEKALADLNKLQAEGPGDFKASQYYNEGLAEANRATDTYNASRGLYASGKAAKDLQRTAVDLNNKNRGNWLNEWIATKLNPMQSLAGVGQTAATNMAGQTLKTGNNMANNALAAGQTRAAGYINNANTATGALQGVGNALGSYYGSKYTAPVAAPVAVPAAAPQTVTVPAGQVGMTVNNEFQPSQVDTYYH